MNLNQETVYIKTDMNTLVYDRNVILKDVIKIEGANEALVRQIKQLKLYTFPAPEKKNRMKNMIEVFSILKVIQLIQDKYPGLEVQNLGESDFVVEYIVNPDKPKWLEIAKLAALCVLVFFGSGFTIMAFNNDISIIEVFERFYQQIMGIQKPAVTELEICYSIGIAIGVMVFFNHIGNKKISADPTPIQVEMRKFEQDISTTLIENASRKGHNQDVD